MLMCASLLAPSPPHVCPLLSPPPPPEPTEPPPHPLLTRAISSYSGVMYAIIALPASYVAMAWGGGGAQQSQAKRVLTCSRAHVLTCVVCVCVCMCVYLCAHVCARASCLSLKVA